MSCFLIAAPETLATAAADLATIDSSVSAAHTAAAAPTVALVPAATDEVSASVAHLFSQHAKDYQAVAEQAAAFHQQFIQNLNASARSYSSTEAANASSLPSLNAGANAGAQNGSLNGPLLPVQVTGEEALLLLLLLLSFQWELAVPLLLLIRIWPTPLF